MARVQCPYCHSASKVDDKYIGHKAPCPKCGKEFTLKAHAAVTPDTPESTALDSDDDEPAEDAPILKRGGKSQNKGFVRVNTLSDKSEWFFEKAGQVQGPLPASGLELLASLGQLPPGSLVKRGPTGEWMDLGSLQFYDGDGDRPDGSATTHQRYPNLMRYL